MNFHRYQNVWDFSYNFKVNSPRPVPFVIFRKLISACVRAFPEVPRPYRISRRLSLGNPSVLPPHARTQRYECVIFAFCISATPLDPTLIPTGYTEMRGGYQYPIGGVPGGRNDAEINACVFFISACVRKRTSAL